MIPTLLLIPIGVENAVKKIPYITISLISLCILAFLFTGTGDVANIEKKEAELERVSEWTIKKIARNDTVLEERTKKYPSTLSFLSREKDWQRFVTDSDDLDRLQYCLSSYKKLTRSHPFYKYGFIPSNISIKRLVFHQFLHADIFHLVFNMLFLWVLGPLLEATWGRFPFAIFYLFSGFTAAMTHTFFNPSSIEPAIGASGAIAGIMGAVMVIYYKQPIKIAAVTMIALVPRIYFISVPAIVFLGLWICEQILWAFITVDMNMNTDIAFLAHIGGFVFGTLVGIIFRLLFLK